MQDEESKYQKFKAGWWSWWIWNFQWTLISFLAGCRYKVSCQEQKSDLSSHLSSWHQTWSQWHPSTRCERHILFPKQLNQAVHDADSDERAGLKSPCCHVVHLTKLHVVWSSLIKCNQVWSSVRMMSRLFRTKWANQLFHFLEAEPGHISQARNLEL